MRDPYKPPRPPSIAAAGTDKALANAVRDAADALAAAIDDAAKAGLTVTLKPIPHRPIGYPVDSWFVEVTIQRIEEL